MISHPTLDETLTRWPAPGGLDESRLVTDLFPSNSADDTAHRQNCRILIQKGWLVPEDEYADGLAPYQRDLDYKTRYKVNV